MDCTTDLLILHEVTENDISEVARTWSPDRSLTGEEAAGVIAYIRGNHKRNTEGRVYHLCLAVCTKDAPQRFIGWCGLDGSANCEEPEIFILLDAEHRGRGYGTQCVRKLLGLAEEVFALKSVHGSCAADNIASQRAMEKGGMVRYAASEDGAPRYRYTAAGRG